VDVLCVYILSAAAVAVVDVGLLPAAGVLGTAYFTASTVAGGSPGLRLVGALRHRAPSIFASRRPISA
jgi:hypothetical protein